MGQQSRPNKIILPDQKEIAELMRREGAHESAIRAAAENIRKDKFMAKLAAKIIGGTPKFNLVWHKIEKTHETQGSFTRARIMQSRDVLGQHFTLAAEIDYGRIFDIHQDMQEMLSPEKEGSLQFLQHRATIFSLGTYNTMAAAEEYLNRLEQYFMHVMAEKGAEGSHLEVGSGETKIVNSARDNLENSYSDALRTARLVEAFRMVADRQPMTFRMAVGKIVPAFIDDLELEQTRTETEKLSRQRVMIDLGRDIGVFGFVNNGERKPATLQHWTYPANNTGDKKLRFEGPMVDDVFQRQFIDWVAAAAHERGHIDDGMRANMTDALQEIRGVSLRRSKLGLLSPFPSEDTSGLMMMNRTMN